MNGLTALEIEEEHFHNAILAAEQWSDEYKKDPDTFAKLIKVESRLETILRRYFKEQSERVPTYINWFLYAERVRQIQAADDLTVDVIISDNQVGYEDGLFISTAYDPIAQAVALGAEAGEKLYSISVGNSQSSEIVQRTAKELVADLVGKRVDKEGLIVDNPNAKYKVNETTRKLIRESISTSISLGEDQKAATTRLQNTIKDPKRAAKIAQTEAVNSYQRGILVVGQQTGAVGKEWLTLAGACKLCEGNAAAGPIPINQDFPSGHKAPACHPGDRCAIRLIYPQDPDAKKIRTTITPSNLDDTDLLSITRAANKRPAAEINTKIEELLNHGDSKTKVTQAIEQAMMLPKDDAIAMLGAINYNGKSVIQDYYTVRFNQTTKKIERVLKDPAVDPLKLTPAEIFKNAKKK